MKFIFAHPLYLQGIRAKFVYKGHWVKVKVTGAKSRKSLFPQCKTSIDNNSGSIKHIHNAWGFRIWRIEGCDRHLCDVTGSNHA